MWVNITLQGMSVDEIISLLKNLYEISSSVLVLTFNTSKSRREARPMVEAITMGCKKENIPIKFGPQFFYDECILKEESYFIQELFLTTPGERLVWYMAKHGDNLDVSSIALLDGTLGIDPIIVMNKSSKLGNDYQFYFGYNVAEAEDLKAIIKSDKCYFVRTRNKKGEEFDNNN